MEILRGKLTFPLLCLAVGLAVFGVTYTVLGESPAKSPPQADVLVNQTSSDPYDVPLTPLLEAIVTGTPADVRNALQTGADPNELRVGSPALAWAIRGANSPSFNAYGKVRVLLDHGADPNKANALGFTPMHTAAHHGSEAVMNALLDASGDPFKAVPELPRHTPYESALVTGILTRLRPSKRNLHTVLLTGISWWLRAVCGGGIQKP